MMNYGPADLYVLELPEGGSADGIVARVKDVTAAGVVTLLDVALVRKEPNGSRVIAEYDELAAVLGLSELSPKTTGLIGADDLFELTEEMLGATALVVLLENTWARQIVSAAEAAQVRVLSSTRFPAEVVDEVAALLAAAE